MTRNSILIVLATVWILIGGVDARAQTKDAKQSALMRCSRRVQLVPPAVGVLDSDGNHLFVGSVNGTVEALSSGNLESAWRAELGGEFASDLLLMESGFALVMNPSQDPMNTGEMSTIRLLSKETGVTLWSAKVTYSERHYLGRINGGLAIVSKEGQVTLFDRSSGQVQWQTPPFGKLSARPSFSAGSIALATVDKQLTVISAQGGRVTFRHPTEYVLNAVTFLKKEAIATGDQRGNLMLFGAENSKVVWRFKSGAGVSSVSETSEGLLVTSLDNFVYLISDYNGDVIWKRRLTGRVLDGGLSINGHYVVLIYGENTVYVIKMDDGRLTDSIPPSDKDLVNRVPVSIGDRRFALTTVDSVEIFSLGGCEKT